MQNKLSLLSISKNWPAFLMLILGLYFFTFNILGTDLSFVPGDMGDARFNLYILEHDHQYFFTDNVPTEGYWEAPFMYPAEQVLTYSDNLLGTFPIYSFFRGIGLDSHSSFQWWFIVICILNFVCSYVFLYWLSGNKYSSALGAFIFTFSILLYRHLAHAQTFPRFPIALAFLFAAKFMKDLKERDFFLSLLMFTYQFYCGIYLGFHLLIPFAIFYFGVLFRKELYSKLKKLKYALKLAAGLILNVLFLFLLMKPYIDSPARIETPGVMSEYHFSLIEKNIPTFYSYFHTEAPTLIWNSLRSMGTSFVDSWDHQLFPGITVLICVAFVFVLILKRIFTARFNLSLLQWSLMISCALTFVLFIKVGDFSLYKFVHRLPGFFSIRAVQRIVHIELLYFSIILTMVSAYLIKGSKYKVIPFLLIAAFLVVDNYFDPIHRVQFKKEHSQVRINEIADQYANLSPASIVSFEPGIKSKYVFHDQIEAMLAAQKHGMISINGFTSKVAPGYWPYSVNPSEESRNEWLKSKSTFLKINAFERGWEEGVRNNVQRIKENPDWFNSVKKEAESLNIDLEEHLLNNARWSYRYDMGWYRDE